jgi:hypothetical protein
MKEQLTFFIFFLLFFTVKGQQVQANDSLKKVAGIKYNTSGNEVNFTPQTPVLDQIAGAPKAFYTYYWEFGDGHYSTDKTPTHIYKNKGNYEVRLWATNNYDIGKPPATRPQKITINKVTVAFQDEASMNDSFILKHNREPIPEEEIVVIMSYKNPKDFVTNGKLYLFYNERKYKADNFELIDTRTYHNEKVSTNTDFAYAYDIDDNQTLLASLNAAILKLRVQAQDSTEKTNLPLTVEESKTYYKNWSVFEFDDMSPNEERNMFFTLKTTPEMLKDTSAIISMRGVYVPDSNYDNHKVKDMEMEIVTSHDPNKMSSNGTFMNYRLVRFKRIKYKVKFQNNGEGPARTIRLETDIPDMYDKSTLKVEDMYPKCKICPKKEVQYSCLDTTFTDKQIIFTFKNIYLPGSEQKNVKDKDSTKGFVKYSIKFGKDFHKKKTKSKTAIIFDKNDPIITNQSTTRFLPGISIGAKTGYNYFSDLENSKSYFVGATISPYKSYRWYWQVEFMNDFHSYNNTTVQEGIVTTANGFDQFQRKTTTDSFTNVNWEIPVLLRYNINNYIGIGTGFQGSVSVSEKLEQTILTEFFEGTTDDFLDRSEKTTANNATSFTNIRNAMLFDATVGFSRIGPSIGARYVLNFKNEFNYWQFYAIWKF